MVTLPLEKMATRVAGSLCLATGLGEEMIVSRYALNYFYIAHRQSCIRWAKCILNTSQLSWNVSKVLLECHDD